MYKIKKTIMVSASHRLVLDYESECTNRHGHNWLITVYFAARELDYHGMVTDFAHIKARIKKQFDHKFLNDVMNVNPTAENIAQHVCLMFGKCYRVDVEECPGSLATFIDESYGEI